MKLSSLFSDNHNKHHEEPGPGALNDERFLVPVSSSCSTQSCLQLRPPQPERRTARPGDRSRQPPAVETQHQRNPVSPNSSTTISWIGMKFCFQAFVVPWGSILLTERYHLGHQQVKVYTCPTLQIKSGYLQNNRLNSHQPQLLTWLALAQKE